MWNPRPVTSAINRRARANHMREKLITALTLNATHVATKQRHTTRQILIISTSEDTTSGVNFMLISPTGNHYFLHIEKSSSNHLKTDRVDVKQWFWQRSSRRIFLEGPRASPASFLIGLRRFTFSEMSNLEYTKIFSWQFTQKHNITHSWN